MALQVLTGQTHKKETVWKAVCYMVTQYLIGSLMNQVPVKGF